MKIYAIRALGDDAVYIGSTILTPAARLNRHRAAFVMHSKGKKVWCSSFEIIKKGNAYIEILAELPRNSTREHLRKIEQHYMDLNRANLTNKNAAYHGMTPAEYHRNYRQKRAAQLVQ